MTVVIPKADWLTFKQIITDSDSGIILPESSKDSGLCKNIVERVGPSVSRVKPGDEIIILSKSASKLHFPERGISEALFIVKEESVMAVIDEV